MASIGLGIGSFIDGLTSGVNAARQWDQADQLQKIRERHLAISENQDKRAADRSALDLKIAQTNLDNSQADRAANAPILDAERKAKLGALNDAAEMRDTFRNGADQVRRDYDTTKAKSIIIGKDSAGNTTYSVDGEKAASKDAAEKMFEDRHGRFMDAYRTKMVPQIVAGYLRRGDTASADAFQKWSDNKDIENAVHDYGRMSQALHMGDYEVASKHFNSMAQNGGYLSQDRHGLKVEPVKDNSGNVTAMRVTYADNVTGANHVKDYALDEFTDTAIALAAPDRAFEQGKADLAQIRAAKAARASERNKLSDQIELEQVKIAGKIAEKRADGVGMDAREYTKAILDMSKNMADNGMLSKQDANGKSVPMTAEESIAAAADRVDQAIARQRTQGGGTMQPGRSVPLFSSPGGQASSASASTPGGQPAMRAGYAGGASPLASGQVTPKSIMAGATAAASGQATPRAATAVLPVASSPPAPQPRQLTPEEVAQAEYARRHGLPPYWTVQDVDAYLSRESYMRR